MANTKKQTNVNNEKESSVDINTLLSTIAQLQKEVENLKNEKVETIPINNTTDTTNELLKTLLNNKNNREVTIVHNQEMIGNLCTNLELSNLNIRLHNLGEERTIDYSQFQELVSKYSGFVKDGIIQVSAKDRDLCEKFQIKCYDEGEQSTLTSEDLAKLGDMSLYELETLYNNLSPASQKVMLSYWLGQCSLRDKNKKFYDRYKLDTLNRISNTYIFDNIIADISADETKKRSQR